MKKITILAICIAVLSIISCSKSQQSWESRFEGPEYEKAKSEYASQYENIIDKFYIEALYDVVLTSKIMKEYVDKGEKVPTELSLKLLDVTDVIHDVVPPKEYNEIKEKFYTAEEGYDYDAFGEEMKVVLMEKRHN